MGVLKEQQIWWKNQIVFKEMYNIFITWCLAFFSVCQPSLGHGVQWRRCTVQLPLAVLNSFLETIQIHLHFLSSLHSEMQTTETLRRGRNQCHSYWWPGHARSQDIIGHVCWPRLPFILLLLQLIKHYVMTGYYTENPEESQLVPGDYIPYIAWNMPAVVCALVRFGHIMPLIYPYPPD